MRFDAEVVAANILDDRRVRRRFVAFSEARDITSDERAYRVQSILVSKISERENASIIGYKIGLLPKGVAPSAVSGVVLSSRRIDGPAKLSDFVHLAIEPEICLWIGQDLPARELQYSSEEIIAAILGGGPAFELTDDRFADFGNFDARAMIADNAGPRESFSARLPRSHRQCVAPRVSVRLLRPMNCKTLMWNSGRSSNWCAGSRTICTIGAKRSAQANSC